MRKIDLSTSGKEVGVYPLPGYLKNLSKDVRLYNERAVKAESAKRDNG